MVVKRRSTKGSKSRRYSKGSKSIKVIARTEARKVVNRSIETKRTQIYSNPGGGHGFINVGASTATGAVVQPLHGDLITNAGTGWDQFIGDKIKPVGIVIKYTLMVEDRVTVDAQTYNHMRVIVVQVKGGGTPTIDNTLFSTGNVATPLSPYEPSYRDTYRVLADKLHLVIDEERSLITSTIRIPASKLQTLHFTRTGVLEANGIFLMFVSDSTAGNHPQVMYWGTMWYKDG